MVAEKPTPFGQLPLELPTASPEETVLQILRDQYLKNDGDLRGFLAELALRQPKPRDPSELWSQAGLLLSKSHR